jgi:hypothetical protein
VQHLAAFAPNRCLAEGLWPLLAKKVNDAIACHAKKPVGDVLDRHQQAVSFHQFVEDLLHDVLCIEGLGTRRRMKLRSRDRCSATISEIRRSCSVIPAILAGSSIYCRRRTRGSNIVEIRVGGT